MMKRLFPVFLCLFLAACGQGKVAANEKAQRAQADEPLQLAGFRPGDHVNGRLLFGEEGWVFLTPKDSPRMSLGKTAFAGTQADRWQEAVLKLQEEVVAQKAVFVFLAAPDKDTIYPEYLPDGALRPNPTRLDVLAEAAPAAGINFLTPVEALKNGKARRHVYHPVDAHWTQYGAYLAYRDVIAALERQGINVSIVAEDRLSFAIGDMRHGTYGKMLGRDEALVLETEYVRIDGATGRLDRETDDYAHGAFGTDIYVNEDRALPVLLVVGDSFAFPMLPFLAESFGQVVFIHHKSGRFDRRAFEEFMPDVVLVIAVERLLEQPWRAPEEASE